MKKRTTGALLLAAALCLGLCACGAAPSGPADDEIAGDDWRTTGIVRDGGIITRDGEDTDVLVCVHGEDAVFYYDGEVQTEYGSVTYPMAVQGDPWEAFQSIDFADRNGDGDSDVSMLFTENGDTTLLVWFWDDGTETFVFQPEESSVALDAEK